MQQYFVNTPLKINDEYTFTKQQAHHAKNVVRLDNEIVRLVYEGKGYFARCHNSKEGFQALILDEDDKINELNYDITLGIALIRREKFELVLQKATELGVKNIIPFESSRCVVRSKDDKKDRQQERWKSILQEASEQCKRNFIPNISEVKSFDYIKNFNADIKLCAYENAYGKTSFLSDVIKNQKSIILLIGPEGGFSEKEINELIDANYQSITLGNRILRAETAAICACSILNELDERNKKL